MFTIFSRATAAKVRSRSILINFAYAPIAVGIISTVLGFLVGFDKKGFTDANFWTAMTMSISILLSGIGILIYSLRGQPDECESG